jgi:hypothetical protein
MISKSDPLHSQPHRLAVCIGTEKNLKKSGPTNLENLAFSLVKPKNPTNCGAATTSALHVSYIQPAILKLDRKPVLSRFCGKR